MFIHTNVDSGPVSWIQHASNLSDTKIAHSHSGTNSFHLKENDIVYFGDTPFSCKHIELLDRLLRQEFPEEFI